MQTGVNNTALIPQNTFGNIDADISDFKPCSSWVIDPGVSIKTITVYYNATQVVSLYIGLNDTSVKKFGSNSYAMFQQTQYIPNGFQTVGLYGFADPVDQVIYSIGFVTMNTTCATEALTPPPEEVIDLLPNSTFINGTGFHNSTNGTVPDYFISAINSTNATSEKPDNSTMLIVTPAVME